MGRQLSCFDTPDNPPSFLLLFLLRAPSIDLATLDPIGGCLYLFYCLRSARMAVRTVPLVLLWSISSAILLFHSAVRLLPLVPSFFLEGIFCWGNKGQRKGKIEGYCGVSPSSSCRRKGIKVFSCPMVDLSPFLRGENKVLTVSNFFCSCLWG